MDKKHKRKKLEDLLITINDLESDLQKHQGNPLPANAERVTKCIEVLTPFASFFEDSFKLRIQEYIAVYDEAVKGNQAMSLRLPPMIKPMNDLITETLESMIIRLS